MILKGVNYHAAIDLVNLTLTRENVTPRLRTDLTYLASALRAQRDVGRCLDAAFLKHRKFYVLSNFQLKHEGDVVHIDHLVISDCAIFVIDSQTISEHLYLDRGDRWFRLREGRRFPIRPPIELLEPRIETLFAFLGAQMPHFMPGCGEEAKEQFLTRFARVPLVSVGADVKVHGWKSKAFGTYILELDEIPAAVQLFRRENALNPVARLLRKRKGAEAPLPMLSKHEFTQLVQLLRDRDTSIAPVRAAAKTIIERWKAIPPALLSHIKDIEEDSVWYPEDVNVAADALTVLHFCNHCQSDELRLEGDESGYRFECLKCEKATPIIPTCPECSGSASLFHDRRTYFVRCGECKHERVYFVNPE